MASDTVDNADAEENEPSLAPFYPIPPGRIVTIEHPGIVDSAEKGLRSVGGEAQLIQIFDESAKGTTCARKRLASRTNQLGLALRPDDILARKILSTNVPTQNVLLRVTVPKRTGRKRKRGSDEPFVESTAPDNVPPGVIFTAQDVLQRLRDNPDGYRVQAVGMLHETHRLNTVPDVQIRLSEIPIMRRIRDHVLQPNYEALSKFDVDVECGSYNPNEIPPPPVFLAPGPPLQYGYQQHNDPLRSAVPPLHMPRDIGTPVPQQAPAHLPKIYIRAVNIALPLLREILARRPIITIYVAAQAVPGVKKHLLEIALLYLTYYADFGPWRGAYIRYGVDPRTSNEHRLAQTVHIDRPAQVRRRGGGGGSHWMQQDSEKFIFDGKLVEDPQQQIYQLCDLTAPLLRSIVDNENSSDQYDSIFGWVRPGNIVKLQILTREMIDCLLRGTDVPTHEHRFIADLPVQTVDAKAVSPKVQGGADQAYLSSLLDEYLDALAGAESGLPIVTTVNTKNAGGHGKDDDDDDDDDDDEYESKDDEEDEDEDDDDDGDANNDDNEDEDEDEDNQAEQSSPNRDEDEPSDVDDTDDSGEHADAALDGEVE